MRKERENFSGSQDQIAHINRLNDLDNRLYDVVRADFQRRLDGLWSKNVARLWRHFERELAEFRAVHDEINSYAVYRTKWGKLIHRLRSNDFRSLLAFRGRA